MELTCKDFCLERIMLNLEKNCKKSDYQSCLDCYDAFVEYCHETIEPMKVGSIELDLIACLYTDPILLSQMIDEYMEQ